MNDLFPKWMYDIPTGVNSLFIAVLTFLLGYAGLSYRNRRAKTKEDYEKLLKEVGELKAQLSEVQQVAKPIWSMLQAKLVSELTHLHEPRTDALLARLDPFVLTVDEEVELIAAMEAREIIVDDLITSRERDSARMLPMVIRRVREELKASEVEMTLVKIPVAKEGTTI